MSASPWIFFLPQPSPTSRKITSIRATIPPRRRPKPPLGPLFGNIMFSDPLQANAAAAGEFRLRKRMTSFVMNTQKSLPFRGRVGLMANEIARALRKRMTPQEVKLWVKLREMRPIGLHFRRQAPRDGYVLDFACLRKRIIVEVDGGHHGVGAHSLRDDKRDRHF